MNPGEVDSCMTLGAGHPMGPLALLDFVGLDVAAAIGDDAPSRRAPRRPTARPSVCDADGRRGSPRPQERRRFYEYD